VVQARSILPQSLVHDMFAPQWAAAEAAAAAAV
jgi:hypothetical protein